ncbi:hypothetical protein ACGFWI_33910 [Streptomyces sp. NPDC048434]|uniref:hypothetical protein n=1 Tax=Streptomyces sp. NPDC048434 TaxID=3365549 RepID=UPI0037154C84
MIQPSRFDGTSLGPPVTGRTAAVTKELVCRFTVWPLRTGHRTGGGVGVGHG